jgi:hypothetical protein
MKKMILHIPDIGEVLTLAAPWTFRLYDESRNESLMELVDDSRLKDEYKSRWDDRQNDVSHPVTIPADEQLRVDRIYIRKGKGMSDYSSVTFYWVGKRTEAQIIHHPEHTYQHREYHPDYHWASYHQRTDYIKTVTRIEPAHTEKIPRKAIRFWAKLADVNTMEIK